jgi:hypothetical protein
MKRLIIIFSLLSMCLPLTFIITNCRSKSPVFQNNICNNNYVGLVNNEKGTIHLVSPAQEWYVIIPDYDDSQRFLPDNLPELFKKDGLKVIFSGKICEIPANVRLFGTPFILTGIEVLK